MKNGLINFMIIIEKNPLNALIRLKFVTQHTYKDQTTFIFFWLVSYFIGRRIFSKTVFLGRS